MIEEERQLDLFAGYRKCLFCKGGVREDADTYTYPGLGYCVECSGTGWVDVDKYEEHRLKKKFGHYWAIYYLKNPLDTDKLCYCCYNKAARRIEVNIWGTIYQYDTCACHAAQYDGNRMDCLPERSK